LNKKYIFEHYKEIQTIKNLLIDITFDIKFFSDDLFRAAPYRSYVSIKQRCAVPLYTLPLCSRPKYFGLVQDHNQFQVKTASNRFQNFGNFSEEDGSDIYSTYPCSQFFRGPDPLSESETKAVEEFLRKNEGKVKFFNSIQNFGEKIFLSEKCEDEGKDPG
jgi:Zinc carboxypeptidase